MLPRRFFSRLKAEKFLVGLEKPEFVLRLTDFYQRTNELHPFREGMTERSGFFCLSYAVMRVIVWTFPSWIQTY